MSLSLALFFVLQQAAGIFIIRLRQPVEVSIYKWQRKQPKEILSLEGNAIFIWRAAQSTFSNFSFSAPRPCFLYPQTAPKVGPSPFSVYHIIPPLSARNQLTPAREDSQLRGKSRPRNCHKFQYTERAQDNLSPPREKFAAS